MNFARLNHILIPATSEGRDRLRHTFLARALSPLGWGYAALSDEGRILTVMMMFIGTAGLEVATTEVYVLWSLLVGVLIAAVIARPFFGVRGLKIDVQVPRRVCVGADASFTLTLRNESARQLLGLRVRGPFLPWDGRWMGAQPRVGLLEPGDTTRVSATARFIQRGHHHLDPFAVCALVPLGLSLGPGVRSSSCRFVVVPKIASVARLTLPLGRSYQPGGIAKASHTGEAMELMGVRPYRFGDPVRDLHPKTWARIGTPHVREYQQEYFTRIGIIVDNARESLTEDGFEATISLTAGVVAKLTRGEALIDLLVLGADVHPLTIGRSLGGLDQALDVLAAAEPADPVDNSELIARLESYLARISCIVLVTQSADETRLALVDALQQRGIAVRMLRVHDDTRPAWLERSPRIEARHRSEQVIDASRIQRGETLAL